MSWDSLVVVTDVDIGRYEPEAVSTDQPWGASSWPDQIELAKKTLEVWVNTDHNTIVGAADRIRNRYVFGEAKSLTSGTYTDRKTEASNDTEEDVPLATIYGTPASDYTYLGARYTFGGVFVHLLDSVNAEASTLTVSYWGQNQWTSVPSQSDGTAVSGATMAQSGSVTWADITSSVGTWERRSLDGSDEGYYWVRLAVSATLTAGTAASHLLAIRPNEGLRAVVSLLALSYIMRGSAAQSPSPEEWRERADAYMEDARTLYDRLKTTGGIPIDTDVSGGIDPAETGPGAAVIVGRMPRA